MNTIKKSALTAVLALAVCVLSVGGALAAPYFPYDIDKLEGFLASKTASNDKAVYTAHVGSFGAGNFYVTQLGYEAGNTNTFNTSTGATLFTNTGSGADFNAGIVKLADLTGAYFRDTKDGENFFLTNSAAAGKPYSNPNVKIFDLAQDWTLKNGLTLTAGTMILGLNDNKGCTGDSDFDDMILAISKTRPTPLPGAVWLLGSGLLGIMGFNRARKGGKA